MPVYDLHFKTNMKKWEVSQGLTMPEIITAIKQKFKLYYDIENGITPTNQIIYNLLKRPNTTNLLYRNFCKIKYHVSDSSSDSGNDSN